MSVMDEWPIKGEYWRHTKSEGRYQVLGTTYNTITDCVDVRYAPCYDDGGYYREFTRQMMNHPKAWLSKNDDGTPRFVRDHA